MDELEVQDLLFRLLEESSELSTSEIKHIASFCDEGILTNNRGLVVLMDDGSEFQITIVQSK